MYAHELFEQNKPRVVVTYPGRFQPFHQGHAGVFSQLQKKFGADNVFIATSNDQSSAKSPFNFSDKYQLMTAAGVPADKIIQTNAMYALPEGIDPFNTIFITAVGAPDADRLNPDSVLKRDKKDKQGNIIKPAGSPGYYKKWDPSRDPLTADQHGYVIVIPEIKKSVNIKGKTYDVSHGTETRNLWNAVRDDDTARAEFLSQLYGRPSQELANIFDKIPQTTSEDIVADNGDSTSPIHGGQIYEQGLAEGASGMFSKVMGHETSPEAAKQIQQQGFKNTHTGIFFNVGDQNYSGGGYGGTVITAKVSGPADGILDLDDDDNFPDDLDEFADGEEVADYARGKGYWAWTDGVQFAVLDPSHIQVAQQAVSEGSGQRVEIIVGPEMYVGKTGVIGKMNQQHLEKYPGHVLVNLDGRSGSVMLPKNAVKKQGVAEDWSQKYKNSINCSHPKGFSQKAHCAGKKKSNEDASGVIATKKQARDPRYSMSLTKDVRPGQIEKNLRAFKLAEQADSNNKMFDLFAKFLPLAMKDLGLTTLPKIVPELHIESHDGQATFGRFVNDELAIHLALANRHPVDILRTLAHELVHFKQLTLGKIKDTSGETGSPEENQANTIAGIIMRHFNKKYPDAVNMQPINLDESLVTVNYGIGKNPGKLVKVGPGGKVPHAKLHVNVDKKTAKKLGIPHLNENGDDEADEVKKQKNLIPFPKGTVKVDVSDVYDWYKLGMGVSDLDDADPADFGKGPPQTVMAFGDEEQEHKYLPQLQRLGLQTHDIDENFADGRNPGDKGSLKAKVKGKVTMAKAKAILNNKNSTPRAKQLAHWFINMNKGRNK